MPLSLMLLLLATSHALTPSDSGRVVTIIASDYALAMPDSIPAGVTTFRLRNRGTEYHIAVLARLDSGKTATEFFDAYEHGGEPAWAPPVGGPGPAMPGRAIATTLTLTPGRYVVFCDISTRDHTAHWKKGMFKLLTVVPSSSASAPPVSDVTVTLVDYTFQLSKPLTAGAHIIRVTNASRSKVHMMAIARFRPGKTLDDELKWDHHSPEPIVWTSGTTDLAPGLTAYVRATLAPGSYGMLCADQDPDGTPHLKHGMYQHFTVK